MRVAFWTAIDIERTRMQKNRRCVASPHTLDFQISVYGHGLTDRHSGSHAVPTRIKQLASGNPPSAGGRSRLSAEQRQVWKPLLLQYETAHRMFRIKKPALGHGPSAGR